MKKKCPLIIIGILSATLLFGCSNSEIEALRNENEQLKIQLQATPTPRPLEMRKEKLEELQNEYAVLDKYKPEISKDTRNDSRDFLNIINKNLNEPFELVGGINGEENFNALIEVGNKLLSEYEGCIKNGEKERADEIQKELNMLFYGNEEGVKTW